MLIRDAVWPTKIQKFIKLTYMSKRALEINVNVSIKIMWHNVRDNGTQNVLIIFKRYYNDELIDNIAIDTYEQ